MEEEFFTWLSKKVSPAQLSELYTVYAPIDYFCNSRSIIKKPLFKVIDLQELDKIKDVVEKNKTFHNLYRKQVRRMSAAIRYYIDFIKEKKVKNVEDVKTDQISYGQPGNKENIMDYGSSEILKLRPDYHRLVLSKVSTLAFSTPLYFCYRGIKHFVDNWRNVYIGACKCLIKDFPYVFTYLAGRSIMGKSQIDVGFKSHITTMTEPRSISDLYVVETNMSDTDMMKRLGALIEICNIDYDELTVIYKIDDKFASPYQTQELNNTNKIYEVKTDYKKWMVQNGMSEKSLLPYISSTKSCGEYSQKHGYIDRNLFLITDPSVILNLKNTLMEDSVFLEWNKGHYNRYLIALDKYYLFRKNMGGGTPLNISKPVNVAPKVFDSKIIERYKEVLHDKFLKGYRLDSNIDLRKFKKTYEIIYGDIDDKDDETIRKIIKCCGIEHDGRLYLSETMISEDSKSKLLSYIDELFSAGREIIYYSAVFKELTEVFYGSRIYTPEMLKAYLEHVAADKYYFEKQYLSVGANIKAEPVEEIRNYLINRGCAVGIDEICNSLSHLPEKIIVSILRRYSEFVRNSKGVYFAANLISLSDDQLNKICYLIQNDIDQWGYAIGSEILRNVNIKYPDILEPYNDFSELGLRNALAHMLGNKYSFNGNVISESGKNISMSDVYANFSRQHNHFTLAELETLKAETGSGLVYFDSVYNNALRISENEFISFENAHFDIVQTDIAIGRYMTKDYIPISEIREFGTFPYAGYPWNSFFLESYSLKYSQKYLLMNNGFNAHICVGAIVKKGVGINDFQELLVHVLADSLCELYPEQALDYLYKKGYIGRRIMRDIEKILADAKVLRSKKG